MASQPLVSRKSAGGPQCSVRLDPSGAGSARPANLCGMETPRTAPDRPSLNCGARARSGRHDVAARLADRRERADPLRPAQPGQETAVPGQPWCPSPGADTAGVSSWPRWRDLWGGRRRRHAIWGGTVETRTRDHRRGPRVSPLRGLRILSGLTMRHPACETTGLKDITQPDDPTGGKPITVRERQRRCSPGCRHVRWQEAHFDRGRRHCLVNVICADDVGQPHSHRTAASPPPSPWR